MWSLSEKQDGSFVLVFDRDRRRTNQLRGSWEIIGAQGTSDTQLSIDTNRRHGSLCCNDNEGNVRILVLED